MMNQATTQRSTACPDGTSEAAEAERHAGDLEKLLADGTLSPDGQAIAHGLHGVIRAILALRETAATAMADTADAVTDVDATLGILAGAIVETTSDPAGGNAQDEA